MSSTNLIKLLVILSIAPCYSLCGQGALKEDSYDTLRSFADFEEDLMVNYVFLQDCLLGDLFRSDNGTYAVYPETGRELAIQGNIFLGSFIKTERMVQDLSIDDLSIVSNTFHDSFSLVENYHDRYRWDITIWSNLFKGQVNLYSIEFDSSIRLYENKFESDVSFKQSKFSGQLDLSNNQFNGHVDFSEVQLPSFIRFYGVKSNHIIDLTSAYFSESRLQNKEYCEIDLRLSEIDQFRFNYSYLRLYIPDKINELEYERMTRVYEGVLKNMRRDGFWKSYELVDKEYRQFNLLQKPYNSRFNLIVAQMLNFINKNWDDYGYEKERIWLWTIGLFSIFTLLNWARLHHLNRNVYTINSISRELWTRGNYHDYPNNPHKYGLLNFRGFDQAIFYTALIFFGLKMNTQNLNFHAKRGVTFILVQYVLGLICLAYLANFVILSNPSLT